MPALYAAAAWMLRSVAALSDTNHDSTLAVEFRQNASALEASLFNRLYVKGAGYFATAQGTQPSWNRIDVRTVVDFNYIGHFLNRYPTDNLDFSTRKSMVEFVKRELISKDWQWLRALSPLDGAAASPLVQRSDHGTTGSYDAWVSLAAESLADLSGNFTDMLNLLRGSSAATAEGCYGNNHFISQNGHPVKTLDNGVYIADNGVNFGDVIVRTLFGYDPAWLASNTQSHLYLQNVSRGDFSGHLINVRAAGRLVTIVADRAGVQLYSLAK